MANTRINPRTGKRFDFVDRHAEKLKQEAEDRARERELELLLRVQRARECQDDLLKFTQFTMPDPEAPNDIERSTYEAAGFHKSVAKHLEQVERGDIRQLIFCMPPRHGKSALATKSFAAWYSGRNPTHDLAIASYSDTMANDFGADTRFIMLSKLFQQVFPKHKLRRGGTAKDNIQTTAGGRLVYVGRGGALTGRGAHCFPAETMVETVDGARQISSIRAGDEVLSYDVARKCAVWKKVQAVAARPKAGLLRITTTDGRVVEATQDHRFYADGRWVEAHELTPGCAVVLSLRDDGHSAGVRRPETRTTWTDKFLLLQRMLGCRGKRGAVRSPALHALWCRGAQSLRLWFKQARARFLLAGMPRTGTSRGSGAASSGADAPLRALQRHVRSAQRQVAVLWNSLRFESACWAYAEGGQPTLEERRERQPGSAARHATFPRIATACHQTGWRLLRALFVKDALGGASHRREPTEQSREQLSDALPAMSRTGSFFRAGAGIVASVEDTCRDADVYDIQVAETECFFANGVLAHNCLLIDDIFKDFEEARSQAIRDQAWNWFTKVAMTRRMGKKLVVVTMTRWHSDDIIGRLTDPENPYYNEQEAAGWKIIRFPAIAEEEDPLRREPGQALWPARYDLDFLRSQQRLDPLGFSALYQQRPTVADGVLFRRETIQYYDKLPENLRYYAASDHAVGTNQRNDPSCLLKVGVDAQDNIYVVDVDWRRMPTDVAVEAMLTMCSGSAKPLLWWAERGHISKSIGPFLRKRMLETGTYINIVEVTPASDKEQRAQSISARVAMGKVYFPRNAVWTERAINELLAFPNGNHDDFVDSLAYIGLGLESQFGRKRDIKAKTEPPAGSLAFLRANDKRIEARKRVASLGGF